MNKKDLLKEEFAEWIDKCDFDTVSGISYTVVDDVSFSVQLLSKEQDASHRVVNP